MDGRWNCDSGSSRNSDLGAGFGSGFGRDSDFDCVAEKGVEVVHLVRLEAEIDLDFVQLYFHRTYKRSIGGRLAGRASDFAVGFESDSDFGPDLGPDPGTWLETAPAPLEPASDFPRSTLVISEVDLSPACILSNVDESPLEVDRVLLQRSNRCFR